MIYDAVSMARRGVSADELRLATPAFLDAVRWAAFAERLWQGTDELQTLAARTMDGIPTKDRPAFMAARAQARDEIQQRRIALLLDDPDPPAVTTNG